MDTKLRRKLKPRVDVSLTRRQQQERERLIRMKRDSRPMPMQINGSSVRRSPAPPVRSSSPVRRAPMLQRAQRPRSRSPPMRKFGGVQKQKRETMTNELGRVFRVKKGESTRAKSCSKVVTFPQEGAICWFAALFTSLFFSQYSRVVIRNHARRMMSDQSSRHICSAILEILRGYDGDKVSSRVLESMRPRQFLHDLRIARPDYFSSMTNGSDEAHYAPYSHAMLAFLQVPHLSIGVVNGNFKYSGFNVDLPLDSKLWSGAMKTMSPKGVFVDTRKPEVLIIHKDSGEDFVQTQWSSPVPAIGSIQGYNPKKHAKIIKYNGTRYILDSCIIGAELRTNTCSVAHAIAGVTCNGEKYVYNGWTARSGDPAMRGSKSAALRDIPCALGKQNWDEDSYFRINMAACSFNRATPTGKELMFNAVDRSSVTYIRYDLVKAVGYKKLGRQLKK